jgi:hypothetical protein
MKKKLVLEKYNHNPCGEIMEPNKESTLYSFAIYNGKDFTVRSTTNDITLANSFGGTRIEKEKRDNNVNYMDLIEPVIQEVIRQHIKNTLSKYGKDLIIKYGTDNPLGKEIGQDNETLDNQINDFLDGQWNIKKWIVMSRKFWLEPKSTEVSFEQALRQLRISRIPMLMPIADIYTHHIEDKDTSFYRRRGYASESQIINIIRDGHQNDDYTLRFIRYVHPITQRLVLTAYSLDESIQNIDIYNGKPISRSIRELIDSNKLVAYYDWYKGTTIRQGGLFRLQLVPTRSAKVPTRKKLQKKRDAKMYQSDMRIVEDIVEKATTRFLKTRIPKIDNSLFKFNFTYNYRTYSCAYNKTVTTISENLAIFLSKLQTERGYKGLLSEIKKDILSNNFMKRQNIFLKHKDPDVKFMGEFLESIKPKGARNECTKSASSIK